jgi:hypothetical protein
MIGEISGQSSTCLAQTSELASQFPCDDLLGHEETDTRLTTNDRAGLVLGIGVPPQYFYIFWRVLLPMLYHSFCDMTSGVRTGLQPCIPTFLSISLAYFSCDNTSPSADLEA